MGEILKHESASIGLISHQSGIPIQAIYLTFECGVLFKL